MRHPSARTDFGQIKRLQIMLVNVPEWFMLHVCSTPYFAAQIASIYHWSFSVETQQTPPRHTHKHTHTHAAGDFIFCPMQCIAFDRQKIKTTRFAAFSRTGNASSM